MKRVTSIVIVTCNQLEYTKLCLDSIRKHTEPGSYELIAVDNASTDGTAEWLKTQPDVNCIFNQEDRGASAGYNQGLLAAQGSELLLLGSEVLVTPRWLEQLRTALYADARTGAVSCLTNSSSNFQQTEVSYNTQGELTVFGEGFNHLQPGSWQYRNKLAGFCFLFKRELYELIGGLDEALGSVCYDDDYSLRIMQQGYRLLVCGDTFVHRLTGEPFLQTANYPEREKETTEDKSYFAEKWHISDYCEDNVFFREAWGDLPETGKVMYIGAGTYGGEALLLQGQHPGLVVHMVTSDELEAAVLSQRFLVQLAKIHTSDVLSCFDEKYDFIFYKVDIGKLTPAVAERVLNGLSAQLEPGGRLYFYQWNKVCQLGPGQSITANISTGAPGEALLRKCACCGHKLAHYAPMLGYYAAEAEKHAEPATGTGKPWLSEMVNGKEYLCHYCGAADRDRAYAVWMDKHLPKDRSFRILDIAPAIALQEFIREHFPLADYKCGDLYMKGVDYQLDIMNMYQLADNSIDFFLCSHVLEHVRDDRQAMRELARILSPAGCGILVVPIDLNCTEMDEDPDCEDEGERWRRFGQGDHVRKYTRSGYIDRLKQYFSLELYEGDSFTAREKEENALLETSTLYIVRKKNSEQAQQ